MGRDKERHTSRPSRSWDEKTHGNGDEKRRSSSTRLSRRPSAVTTCADGGVGLEHNLSDFVVPHTLRGWGIILLWIPRPNPRAESFCKARRPLTPWPSSRLPMPSPSRSPNPRPVVICSNFLDKPWLASFRFFL